MFTYICVCLFVRRLEQQRMEQQERERQERERQERERQERERLERERQAAAGQETPGLHLTTIQPCLSSSSYFTEPFSLSFFKSEHTVISIYYGPTHTLQ